MSYNSVALKYAEKDLRVRNGKRKQKYPKDDLVTVSSAAWHSLILSKEHQVISNQEGEKQGKCLALAFWLKQNP